MIRAIKVMTQCNLDQRHGDSLQSLLGQLPGGATSTNAVFPLCVLKETRKKFRGFRVEVVMANTTVEE